MYLIYQSYKALIASYMTRFLCNINHYEVSPLVRDRTEHKIPDDQFTGIGYLKPDTNLSPIDPFLNALVLVLFSVFRYP